MTARLAVIASWLLGGHLLLLGIFWGLLNIPESSVLMLGLSALTVVALVAGVATIHAGAVAAWQHENGLVRTLLTGIRHAPPFLLATLLFCVIRVVTGWLLEWHAGIAGQIDAMIIARTGSPRTEWLHALVFWALQFVRWPLALTLSLTLLAAVVRGGFGVLRDAGWVRAALRPARWLLITVWLVLLIVLPVQAVDWRPGGLALSLEPWFVAAKLGLIAVAAAVGWALILRTAARD
ncbi:MAG TPA: hypothetical protein VF198_14595 [Vicinamibacterales bacterium]